MTALVLLSTLFAEWVAVGHAIRNLNNGTGLNANLDEICSGKVVHGIANSGNDCFLSSMMQLIFNSPPICRVVFNEDLVAKASENPVVCLRPFAAKYLKGEPSAHETREFRTCLNNRAKVEIKLTTQADASEAFTLLLAKYDLEGTSFINKVREYKRFRRTAVCNFADGNSGLHVVQSSSCATKEETATCETVGTTVPSATLSLPLPGDGKRYKLDALYHQYYQGVEMDDPENAMRVHLPADKGVGAGKDGRVQKFTSITADASESFPSELIVAIQRFKLDFTVEPFETIKLHNSVEVPLEWRHPKSTKENDQCYDLVGIVLHHSQSARGGHYTSWRKDSVGSGWVHIDDRKTDPKSEQQAVDVAKKALLLQYRARGAGNCSSGTACLRGLLASLMAISHYFLFEWTKCVSGSENDGILLPLVA